MDREIAIGDTVRVKLSWKGKGKQGVVTRDSRGGTCWVVRGAKGEDEYHKSYCTLIRRAAMSQAARCVDSKLGYGDGEV
jgi:hypothetical protein